MMGLKSWLDKLDKRALEKEAKFDAELERKANLADAELERLKRREGYVKKIEKARKLKSKLRKPGFFDKLGDTMDSISKQAEKIDKGLSRDSDEYDLFGNKIKPSKNKSS
jgi:hypothetical protein